MIRCLVLPRSSLQLWVPSCTRRAAPPLWALLRLPLLPSNLAPLKLLVGSLPPVDVSVRRQRQRSTSAGPRELAGSGRRPHFKRHSAAPLQDAELVDEGSLSVPARCLPGCLPAEELEDGEAPSSSGDEAPPYPAPGAPPPDSVDAGVPDVTGTRSRPAVFDSTRVPVGTSPQTEQPERSVRLATDRP